MKVGESREDKMKLNSKLGKLLEEKLEKKKKKNWSK